VIEGGTLVTVAFELESRTIAPPAPAAPLRLTVAIADWPPTTTAGVTDMLAKLTACGLIVSPKLSLTPR
jgi:hypothetical protein